MQEFEWDENKNRVNRRKHGIGFEQALEVFSDPLQQTVEDHSAKGSRVGRR